MVELDDSLRGIIDTVKAQRVGGHGNLSVEEGVDLAFVLVEIADRGAYRADYESVTMPLLYEDVAYEDAIGALREIAGFLR